MKKDMKAPRIEYRYCSAQAGNPRVERIWVTFQMSLIHATSLSDSKLSECAVQTVWDQKILKQKIADLIPLGLQTIKYTLSKIKYLCRVVWFICAHMVHTVSFQIYNWRQNCWDTFLKRCFELPWERVPPPLPPSHCWVVSECLQTLRPAVQHWIGGVGRRYHWKVFHTFLNKNK